MNPAITVCFIDICVVLTNDVNAQKVTWLQCNHVTGSCLFLIWLTVFTLFPDVVDNRFTEQVDTLLESLTSLLKRLSFLFLGYNIMVAHLL